jgi:antitoxin CcdA
MNDGPGVRRSEKQERELRRLTPGREAKERRIDATILALNEHEATYGAGVKSSPQLDNAIQEVGMNYVPRGPKKPVNITLSEDLVREARRFSSNLSETVEALLAEHVAAERRKREDKDRLTKNTIDMAIAHYEEFGIIGAEHSPV